MNLEERECPHCRGDEVARYLRGVMTADEATDFEAHLFACEACGAELALAVRVRAAEGRNQAAVVPLPSRRRSWSVAAIAASLLLFIGLAFFLRQEPARVTEFRGTERSIAVEFDRAAGLLRWPPVAGATEYIVDGFDAGGTRLATQTTDTPSMALWSDARITHVRVRARDSQREIAASVLQRVRQSARP